MIHLNIPEDLHRRVAAFKELVEAVLEEEISLDKCAVLILQQGMDAMLADILAPVDQTTLLRSFQQLGARYPTELYSFVAETLRTGAGGQEREGIRRKFGFRPSEE